MSPSSGRSGREIENAGLDLAFELVLSNNTSMALRRPGHVLGTFVAALTLAPMSAAGASIVAGRLRSPVTATAANPIAVVATIPVGTTPSVVAVGEGAVWVVNFNSNSVSRIDPLKNRVAATIAVGHGPDGIAVGEGAVWVANEEGATIFRIDPGTNAVVAKIRVRRGAELRSRRRRIRLGHQPLWDSLAYRHSDEPRHVDSSGRRVPGLRRVREERGLGGQS